MQITKHLVLMILSIFLFSCSSTEKRNDDKFGQAYKSPSLQYKNDIFKADYIRIRTGGISKKYKSKTILEIRGSEAVSKFITPFRLFESQIYAAACECDGDPTIEIYKGGKLITSIAIKHGTALYWPDNWPSEMILDSDVFDNIAEAMSAKGFPEYKEEKEEMKKLAEQLMKKMK